MEEHTENKETITMTNVLKNKDVRKRAEHGDVEAMKQLGLYYDNQNNLILSKKWYLKAAARGDRDAQYRIAVIFKKEHKYYQQVLFLAMSAANQHPSALNSLGYAFSHARGVQEDI